MNGGEVVPFHFLVINWSQEITKIIVDKKSGQVSLKDTSTNETIISKLKVVNRCAIYKLRMSSTWCTETEIWNTLLHNSMNLYMKIKV